MSSDGSGTVTPMRNTLQHTASHCSTRNTLIFLKKIGYVIGWLGDRDTHAQHTATHCNTLQHTLQYTDIFKKNRLCHRMARGP